MSAYLSGQEIFFTFDTRQSAGDTSPGTPQAADSLPTVYVYIDGADHTSDCSFTVVPDSSGNFLDGSSNPFVYVVSCLAPTGSPWGGGAHDVEFRVVATVNGFIDTRVVEKIRLNVGAAIVPVANKAGSMAVPAVLGSGDDPDSFAVANAIPVASIGTTATQTTTFSTPLFQTFRPAVSGNYLIECFGAGGDGAAYGGGSGGGGGGGGYASATIYLRSCEDYLVFVPANSSQEAGFVADTGALIATSGSNASGTTGGNAGAGTYQGLLNIGTLRSGGNGANGATNGGGGGGGGAQAGNGANATTSTGGAGAAIGTGTVAGGHGGNGAIGATPATASTGPGGGGAGGDSGSHGSTTGSPGRVVATLLAGQPIYAVVSLPKGITAAPVGPATDLNGMIVQMWRRFFKKATEDQSTLQTYADDGTSVLTTQTVSDDGTTQTQGRRELTNATVKPQAAEE